jgi:endogenous inhibitor of DNA gyrase (YacG/DUF329 family)
MAGSMKKLKCPHCKRETTWRDNPYRPFCSKECKLADLYSWLSEEYRFKLRSEEVEEISSVREE